MQATWTIVIALVLCASLFAQSGTPKQDDNQAPAQATSSSSNPGDSTHLVIEKMKEPAYPTAARQQQIQGQVWVHLVISETGDVLTAEPVSGNPILASAAIDAMKQWKFEPYIQNGHPVRVSTKMQHDFAFTDKVFEKPVVLNSSSVSDTRAGSGADAGNAGNPSAPNSNQPKQVLIGPGVSQGLLVHQVAPVYPDSARIDRIQGTVVLRATIGKDGRIQNLTPVSSPSKGLTEAAIGAVEQWRYKPYTLNGEAVEVLTTINVNFKLR